jgi:predicted naringenin-chalcone synthase
MPAFLHHLTTRVPRHAYSQVQARDRLKGWTQERRLQRLIHAVYGRSGIDQRHSVLPDFGGESQLYPVDAAGQLMPPSTAQRNAVYAQEAGPLAVATAQGVLTAAAADGMAVDEVTHVIFASCTGFVNPGPDFQVIRQLGLRPEVQRYTLGFMGCCAAFPALRMAAQFCEADPAAVVLVICLELCTLHMQLDLRPDSILANSLFADGAAGALVSARRPQSGYRLAGFASTLVAGSESAMAWQIGDQGFDLVLSSYVPEILGTQIDALVEAAKAQVGWQTEGPLSWAVHPGGRAILEQVEKALALPPEALQASRHVLREFGNMSSPTVLFVLNELLHEPGHSAPACCAMAFGPGLTVELGFLERLGETGK